MKRPAVADLPGIGLVVPIFLLIAWQEAGSAGAIDTGLWATPGMVVAAAQDALRDGSLLRDLTASLQRDLLGLTFGIPAGLAAGTVLALSGWGNRIFGPSLSAIRQVALFTWVPLISLWIGNDEPGKVAFISFAVFFPVMMATEAGVRQADPQLLEVARTLCLSRSQSFRRVLLPAALPPILSGIHVALIYGWLATIGADYLFSAGPGIGSALMTGRSIFRMDQVIVGMVAIALVGCILNAIAGRVERRVLAVRGL